jgi:hypothetical protein
VIFAFHFLKSGNFTLFTKPNIFMENLKVFAGHIKALGGPHVARGLNVTQA